MGDAIRSDSISTVMICGSTPASLMVKSFWGEGEAQTIEKASPDSLKGDLEVVFGRWWIELPSIPIGGYPLSTIKILSILFGWGTDIF